MRVTRAALVAERLVYVLVADKRLRYAEGRSRIAYIGVTTRGHLRIAESVAHRSRRLLELRGVRSFEVRVVTCRARRNVETWRELERALIVSFREQFGEVPLCNSQGKRMGARRVFEIFTRRRVDAVLDEMR
jgi:hypothetical protein